MTVGTSSGPGLITMNRIFCSADKHAEVSGKLLKYLGQVREL